LFRELITLSNLASNPATERIAGFLPLAAGASDGHAFVGESSELKDGFGRILKRFVHEPARVSNVTLAYVDRCQQNLELCLYGLSRAVVFGQCRDKGGFFVVILAHVFLSYGPSRPVSA